MKERQEGKKIDPVLVINDDTAQLKTIADILEVETLQSICCRTGKEALEVCKQQEVNVAILDLQLPDIDGVSLLRQLKQQNPEIKVIINTGYASLDTAMAAVNEEAFAYVRKMGDVEELLTHVHRAFHAHLISYSERLEQEVRKRTAELSRIKEELTAKLIERKQREEELKKLSVAIQQSPASVIIADPEGNIEYVNPRFCKLTGYSAEEVIGKNPRIFKSGETPMETYEQLWETILAGKEWRGKFRNKKKNGELYWEDAIISAILNDKGDITH
ncbi:MAG: response regulator, partial [bacterium]